MRALLLLALAAPLSAQAADRRAEAPAGPIYTDSVAPMDATVTTRLMPQVEALVEQLLRDGKATKIDGVAVFGGRGQVPPRQDRRDHGAPHRRARRQRPPARPASARVRRHGRADARQRQ
ncbi:hypothetical protein [Sphingomonas sp. J315]|uniref:hypothetical protein n=1 Tax=Sphingomonas sp. J315 TaxID=2898433 RepID=UPI0021ADB616|nr:hypothetical protein [Sphingomonas sp. J315]UUX98983.1 hypothetical protein LRS08_16000 [Sphingomonas sp. J315]